MKIEENDCCVTINANGKYREQSLARTFCDDLPCLLNNQIFKALKAGRAELSESLYGVVSPEGYKWALVKLPFRAAYRPRFAIVSVYKDLPYILRTLPKSEAEALAKAAVNFVSEQAGERYVKKSFGKRYRKPLSFSAAC